MKRILLLFLMFGLVGNSCNEDTKIKEKMIIISTEFGDMKIKLYDETPKHKANFLKLASEGFYDGTLFHRVIAGFMIQGGDPKSKGAKSNQQLGSGGPGYTIDAEMNSNFYHKKGAIAAARLGGGGNPNRESSGSQFYIVQGRAVSDADLNMQEKKFNFKYTQEQRDMYKKVGGTSMLDMDYTVFGEVVEGLEVIDKIAAVQKGPGDRPVKDVTMTMKMVDIIL